MSKKIFISLMIITIIIYAILIFKEMINSKREIMLTSTKNINVEDLNNKKIEWGIKRGKNNEQPDLGKINKEIMDEYDGICIGNKEKKYVYLTFDMGYEAGYTEKILEVLKKNDVKAAFFITGHYLNTKSELVERMIEEGHIVGNHTINHKNMPSCDLETIKLEVMNLHTAVYEKFGYEMKYIRPPKGEYSQRTVAYTNTLGYKTVMWSFAYDDWEEDKQGKESYAKNKIMENLHNGEIMLLHATSKDNANILDDIIKQVKNKEYIFRSLDEFEK